ncbi:hypothetical protein Angca_005307, partial [Angiostrongylus cantonensis]
HVNVLKRQLEVIKLKGHICWAIGLSTAEIVQSTISNYRNHLALFTNELHGTTDDAFLSLPCVIGSNGLAHIIKQYLKTDELSTLHKSWKTLVEVQN